MDFELSKEILEKGETPPRDSTLRTLVEMDVLGNGVKEMVENEIRVFYTFTDDIDEVSVSVNCKNKELNPNGDAPCASIPYAYIDDVIEAMQRVKEYIKVSNQAQESGTADIHVLEMKTVGEA